MSQIIFMKEAGISYALPIQLAKPAQRALQNAGISSLKQLSKLREEEVLALHGIGQNAVAQLKKALAENGLSFSPR